MFYCDVFVTDTESPDDKFVAQFVTSQLRPGYHHGDEMNYELVIWTPGTYLRYHRNTTSYYAVV